MLNRCLSCSVANHLTSFPRHIYPDRINRLLFTSNSTNNAVMIFSRDVVLMSFYLLNSPNLCSVVP